MPVKKQKANKKIKRDIKKAVEQLPGLMIEHVKFKEIEQPDELKKLPAPERYEEIETKTFKSLPYEDERIVRQKKMWLWTGVTIFSAIIFLMWGWNMRAAFHDSFAKKQDGIAETAKTTWRDTMKTTEPNKPEAPAKDDMADLKNQIKNNLISIFYVQQASTTASSTN